MDKIFDQLTQVPTTLGHDPTKTVAVLINIVLTKRIGNAFKMH